MTENLKHEQSSSLRGDSEAITRGGTFALCGRIFPGPPGQGHRGRPGQSPIFDGQDKVAAENRIKNPIHAKVTVKKKIFIIDHDSHF